MEKGVKIGEVLVQAGIIDQMQLRSALGHQSRWGGKLGKHLVDLGFVEEDVMLRFLSEQFRMKAVNLLRSRIAPQTFEAVPKDVALKHGVVPIVVKGTGTKRVIVLAMSDPSDLSAIDEIQFRTGAKVEPVLATDSAIGKVLQNYGNFSPEPDKERQFMETARPVDLKRESDQKKAPPQAQTAPPRAPQPAPRGQPPRPSPAPPRATSAPPRPTPPQPPPRAQAPVKPAAAREEIIDLKPEDNLEIVKGDVFMLKATKPPRKKPEPVAEPAPSPPVPETEASADVFLKHPHPSSQEQAAVTDESLFLMRPEAPGQPADQGSPLPGPDLPEFSRQTIDDLAGPMLETPGRPRTGPDEAEKAPAIEAPVREPGPPVPAPPGSEPFKDPGMSDSQIMLGGKEPAKSEAPETLPPPFLEEPPELLDLDEPRPAAPAVEPPPLESAAGPEPAPAREPLEFSEEAPEKMELVSTFEFISPPAPRAESEGSLDLPPGLEPPPVPEPGAGESAGSSPGPEFVLSDDLMSQLSALPPEDQGVPSSGPGNVLDELPSLDLPPLDLDEPPAPGPAAPGPEPETPRAKDLPPTVRPAGPPPVEAAADEVWTRDNEVPELFRDDVWGNAPDRPAPPPGPEPPAADDDIWNAPDQAAPAAAKEPELPPLPDLDEFIGGRHPSPESEALEMEAPREDQEKLPGMDLKEFDFESLSSPGSSPVPGERPQVAALPFEGPPPGWEDKAVAPKPAATLEPPPLPDAMDERLASMFTEDVDKPEPGEPPARVGACEAGDVAEAMKSADGPAEPPGIGSVPPLFFEEPPPEPKPEPPTRAGAGEPEDVAEHLAGFQALDLEGMPEARPQPEPAAEPRSIGEFKRVAAAPDESPHVEVTRQELDRLEDLGEEFLDTREVKQRLGRINRMEKEIGEREFQFDELLSLMMKKELAEITQELFMKELGALKKKVDETRKKSGK